MIIENNTDKDLAQHVDTCWLRATSYWRATGKLFFHVYVCVEGVGGAVVVLGVSL